MELGCCGNVARAHSETHLTHSGECACGALREALCSGDGGELAAALTVLHAKAKAVPALPSLLRRAARAIEREAISTNPRQPRSDLRFRESRDRSSGVSRGKGGIDRLFDIRSDERHPQDVIHCGFEDLNGARIRTQQVDFFGEMVEVFFAESDVNHRPLMRSTFVAHRLGCAINMIGMFLARRKSQMDGIYQASSYRFKPAGRTGLKVGSYFLTEGVAIDFAHFVRGSTSGSEQAKVRGFSPHEVKFSESSLSCRLPESRAFAELQDDPQMEHGTAATHDESLCACGPSCSCAPFCMCAEHTGPPTLSIETNKLLDEYFGGTDTRHFNS